MPGFYGVGCATRGGGKTRWYLERIVKKWEVVCRKFWAFVELLEQPLPVSQVRLLGQTYLSKQGPPASHLPFWTAQRTRNTASW